MIQYNPKLAYTPQFLVLSDHPSLESLSWDLVPAEERFKVFRNLFDTVHSVISGISSLASGALFYNRFHKSELSQYVRKNRLHTKAILAMSEFDEVIRVPIPTGMKADYITASRCIQEEYALLEMVTTVRLIHKTLSSLTLLPQTEKDITIKNDLKVIEDAVEGLMGVKDHDRLVKRYTDIMDVNVKVDKGYIPIQTAFKTTDDFRETHELILGFETFYKETTKLTKMLNKIEQQLRDVQTVIQTRKFLDEEIMEKLHAMIYQFAVHMDMSGTLLTTAQMVEHNFVLCHQTISTHEDKK